MPTKTANFSVLDLLDLAPLERSIFLQVARDGPLDTEALARATGQATDQVSGTLASLVQKHRIRLLTDGRVDAILGRIGSRTTLPAQMWPALLAPERLYSEQEIATLKTAIPMLQFARAKLSEFADHGPSHVLRVKAFATQMAYVMGLTAPERHLLRAAALFHDIGNVVDRDRHHIISQETVEKLAAENELPFTSQEAKLIGLLCRWHRREYDPGQVDLLRDQPIRTGLAASILRVCDAMDIDHRRSDYGPEFRKVLAFFFAEELPYWTSLEEILGVRIRCTPAVSIQVLTRGKLADNMQINMLRGDLATTPLDWTVQEIAVQDSPGSSSEPGAKTAERKALVAFPFDAHSLVMAALSRKHLNAVGCRVDLLCYPDTADGPGWLWRQALADMDARGIDHLVVIGDRPDASLSPVLLNVIGRWQAAGTQTSILNRHEANWSRVPQLLERGVEVTLGSDWAYFWGDATSPADLYWGRIAALCARDPTQASTRVTAQDQAVLQGLLKVAYDAMALAPANSTEGWLACAEPILDRIAANDVEYFANQASRFAETYAGATAPGRLEGRVVVFDRAPGTVPQSFYWILETAIEHYGRAPGPGTQFEAPYAIATWPEGNNVELLAISHWREEKAIPIRLMYPDDADPKPHGNESIVHVRLAADRARAVIERLIAACNRA